MNEQDLLRFLLEAPIAGLAVFAIARLGAISMAAIMALKEISLEAIKVSRDLKS